MPAFWAWKVFSDSRLFVTSLHFARRVFRFARQVTATCASNSRSFSSAQDRMNELQRMDCSRSAIRKVLDLSLSKLHSVAFFGSGRCMSWTVEGQ